MDEDEARRHTLTLHRYRHQNFNTTIIAIIVAVVGWTVDTII